MVLMFSLKQKKTVKIPTKKRFGDRARANQITIIISVEIIKLIVIADGGTVFFAIVVVVGRTFLSLFHRMTVFIRARCRYVLICLIDIISFTDNG